MQEPLYLDHHATTPVDPRVVEKMLPFFTRDWGNAGSRTHRYGWLAKKAVEEAREKIALLLGCQPQEIYFTSGATESNNMALLGVWENYKENRRRLVTSNAEHSSIHEVFEELNRRGAQTARFKIDGEGQIPHLDYRAQLNSETLLVSLLHANSEIGTIHDISQMAAAAKAQGAFVHVDAAQSVGKIPVDLSKTPADTLAFSGHKLYGPKGIGALFIRRQSPRLRLKPLMFGGDQELGVRPGTLNVPAIVGLGEACEIARTEMESEAPRLRGLRDKLWKGLREKLPHLKLNGSWKNRLPHNLNFSVPDLDRGELFRLLEPELAISSGSACSSASPLPSPVLLALGKTEREAAQSLRLGLGRSTTDSDIERALDVLTRMLRQAAPGGLP